MRLGEKYPGNNAQLLTRYYAIASIDLGNNSRVFRRRFLVDRSNHAIAGTLRALIHGLQIAIAVLSKRLGTLAVGQ